MYVFFPCSQSIVFFFQEKKRRELVTNASLRMKRLPDDIPVMETKEHSAIGEFMEDTKESE